MMRRRREPYQAGTRDPLRLGGNDCRDGRFWNEFDISALIISCGLFYR